MIGGIFNRQVLGSCERYDVLANEWSAAPPLKVARHKHSGCNLGQHVYVFCGTDVRGGFLNSIEILDIEADVAVAATQANPNAVAPLAAEWKLINIDVKFLAVRNYPLVVAMPN